MTKELKLTIIERDIDELIPFKDNAKIHDDAQIAKIAASIKRFGFGQPISVDKEGVIIAGHGRRLAAIRLGMKKVSVIVRKDLTPDEVKALRLADNQVAIGDFDSALLQAELASLGEAGKELLKDIFAEKEFDFLDADLGAVNPDAFAVDMDETLAEQRTELTRKAVESGEASVPLAKAFGFKDIPTEFVKHIVRLVARAEEATGLSGGEALGTYAAAMK